MYTVLFIAMVLTKLNSSLGLRLACLLDTLCTNKALNSFSHPHVNTVSMDGSFLEDRLFFLVSLLQGESVSEESNYVVLLESTCPTLVTIPDPNSHTIVLPTNQVLCKSTIGGISKRKLGFLLFSWLQSKILNLYEIKV